MDFAPTERCQDYCERLQAFMDEHVYPAEEVYERQVAETGNPHAQPPVMEELKEIARARGLWNMFHPDPRYGPGLTNAEYAPLAEITGRSFIAPDHVAGHVEPDSSIAAIAREPALVHFQGSSSSMRSRPKVNSASGGSALSNTPAAMNLVRAGKRCGSASRVSVCAYEAIHSSGVLPEARTAASMSASIMAAFRT